MRESTWSNRLYEMQFHDKIQLPGDMWVTRVPGGWIYEFWYPRADAMDEREHLVFVPFSDEFREKPPVMNEPIDFLGLTRRAENCLKAEEITTIGELVKLTPTELTRIPNLGHKSSNDVIQRLSLHGLYLGIDQ